MRGPDCSIERDASASVGSEVVEAPECDEATLIDLGRDADAIGTNWAPVTASVIRAASRCRTVAQVLAAGHIVGAALDVFDPEPHDLSDPLYRDERVILTPDAAFVSEESLRELRTRASRQIADALAGVRPANVVNPEVYARTT